MGIESVDPPPDCFPRLEEQLDQFFGDRSGDGWIRRWTNKDRACYDDYLGEEKTSRVTGGRDYTNFSEQFLHDSSRPPITTLADLLASKGYLSCATRSLTKGHAFEALVDVKFAGDAEPIFRDNGIGRF